MLKLNRLPHRFILVHPFSSKTTGTRTSGPFPPSSRSDLAIPRGWMKRIHKDWFIMDIIHHIIYTYDTRISTRSICSLFPGCWSLRRRNSAIFLTQILSDLFLLDAHNLWFLSHSGFDGSILSILRWSLIATHKPLRQPSAKKKQLTKLCNLRKSYLKSFIKVT